MPAKCGPLLFKRLETHHIFRRTANLQPVAVDDADKIVKLVMRAGHGGFPYRAFGLFTIAHQTEYPITFAVPLGRKRHSDGDRQVHGQGHPYSSRFPAPCCSDGL